MANTSDNIQERIRLFAGVYEHQRTTTTLCIRLCTAKVRGSNPLGSTVEMRHFAPGAATLEQVEDGVQDLTRVMYLRTSPSSLLRSRQVKLGQAHSECDRSVGYLLRLMRRSVGHRLISST